MQKINLRDLFPEYKLDCYIEVPDGDVEAYAASITKAEADIFIQFEREEAAYLRRLFWNRAHYSLDVGDGIENSALLEQPDPAALYEYKLTIEQLYAAINRLQAKQGKRIYAYFFLGMSKAKIARAEGIDEKAVRVAILRGIQKLEKYLRN